MSAAVSDSMAAEGTANARSSSNRLLAGLATHDRALLAPHLEPVSYAVGEAVALADAAIDGICFIEQGIAGVLDSLDDDRRYAVGLVGAEGFIGWPILLGDDRSPYDVRMRAEQGRGLRISADALRTAVDQSPTLHLALLRFVHVFMRQMGRTIVSSLAHSVVCRMARWILLYHDRVRADEICMTHEEFRLMLGVRRSSVTDALHRLEEERAIRSIRGKVLVVDRGRLMALAGNTYGQPERDYARLLGATAAKEVGLVGTFG
ncbi:Crp/Fnr family transcriptional regulator [Sphingomonas sp. TZW2008]|uniref:Crp/Fnr family transcriptional regulator n=1 Tax=Sphingomonas sp. TZW2008 TaxID=1917973 RepID=UPI000A26844B|nr:Crp/Fnr family transcriptional regulator [Sphingomonas sp. TZW2008]